MSAPAFLKQCAPASAELYSPLVLAYIGDAVFELLVRSRVVAGGNRPVNELHRQSASLVKAPTQAAMYHKIEDKLTEEEAAVLKRGRNAKSFTHAKNASITDYRHATGLEALFGYLYLKGNIHRIFELFDLCLTDTVQG
ncbi:MAG: ribonuclease III [Clostridiales bacterium]|jgi:ribonuclease-3 family protein|nr:ribonuclease III [Clostridiales bacterium]